MKSTIFGLFAITMLSGCTQLQEHKFKQAAHKRLDDVLNDSESARFKNERVVWESGSDISMTLCGQINAKNRMGAYVGWRRFYANGILVDGESMIFDVSIDTEDDYTPFFNTSRKKYCND